MLSSAGALAVLPVSPVYASEEFEVKIYAHTGGYQLETWGIELRIDSALLDYVDHTQSSFFNGVVYSSGGSTPGTLRFQAVGTRQSTLPSQVARQPLCLHLLSPLPCSHPL